MRLTRSWIANATAIERGYKQHASLGSIDAFLADWEAAHERLGRKIQELQALRDHRALQVLNNEWPPTTANPTNTTKDSQ